MNGTRMVVEQSEASEPGICPVQGRHGAGRSKCVKDLIEDVSWEMPGRGIRYAARELLFLGISATLAG